jgi:hypothetical protein
MGHHITEKIVRKHIGFQPKIYKRLQDYLENTYGKSSRLLSAVVNRAIKEFLDKETNGD